MHINSMPDLVLRLIFSKVPLQDFLNAGRVCPLWKYYQVETCNQVRSLTLLIGSANTGHLITNSCFTLKYSDLLLNEDGTRMYQPQYLNKRFHVTYLWFTSDRSSQLSNIFPHITTLELAIKFVQGQFLLGLMVPLLAQWSPKLKSLKMYFEFSGTWFVLPPFFTKATNEIQNLLKVINSMQSLGHLTLNTDFSLTEFLKMTPHPDSIDLPILGHLREFYFKSDDSIHIMEESLKCYALANVNLKQVGFEVRNYHQDLYNSLPQLASKIAYSSYYDLPQHLLHQFSSLSYLHFSTNRLGLFEGALKSIASLFQLTYLHYSTSNTQFSQTQASRDQLLQLPSIQVLSISTRLKSESDFESNLWAHLFPSVQVIELDLKVRNIPYNIGPREVVNFRSKQELQKILPTFTQCPNLHHLYTRERIRRSSNPTTNEQFKCTYNGIVQVSEFEWTVLNVRDQKIIINSKQSLNFY